MDEHAHTEPPSEPTLRIKALESLLVEKGLVDPGAVDEIIELFEKRIGPRNGAKVVAHAWPIRLTKNASWKMAARPSPSWVSPASRARTWLSSRTRHRFTMSSC